jgi:hypothetical protein
LKITFRTTKPRSHEAVLDLRQPLRVFVPSWFICLLVFSGTIRADEQWILTTADFKSEKVAIRAIDDAGLHIPGSPERVIPMSQFLQLDRDGGSRATAPRLFVVLIDGDHLGGAPTGISGESLLWRSPALGEISFPLKRVRAIQRAAQAAPLNDANRTEDVLTLVNGDSLRGIVSDLTASDITIQPTGGETTTVSLASIVSADFASPPGATIASANLHRAFRVTTADGTVLTSDRVNLQQRDLHVRLPDGTDRPVPLSSVTGIEQINGPVVWLSSITPTESVQIPSFSQRAVPAQMDRTVQGDLIQLNGRPTYGIGVHSYSRLVFPIDTSCKTFHTQYEIDGDQPWADVTVRVKLDDRVAYEKAHVTSGAVSDVVKLDLNGAKRLTLEVDYGENYDVQDRLNWIEPALLRTPAKPE